MRLKHIKNSENDVKNHKRVISFDRNNIDKIVFSSLFNNNNPVYLEIGIGKGNFILENAMTNSNVNYIGIEMYSSVMIRALEKFDRIEPKIDNIYFMCGDASLIDKLFDKKSIDRLYLNFSDPWPKKRHKNRRLTSEVFLSKYEKILKENAQIEFKTDNNDLFEFTIEEIGASKTWDIIKMTRDLYSDNEMLQNNIKTEYEDKFNKLGHNINKMIIARSDNNIYE